MASLFEVVAAGDGVAAAWSFVTYFLPSYPRLIRGEDEGCEPLAPSCVAVRLGLLNARPILLVHLLV